MPVRKIVTYEDPRLRKRSIRIKRIDHTIRSLVDDMIETMREASGVGLAAPQIGILLRLIVTEYVDDETEELHQHVLINPEIVEKQGEWMAEEGCLSIPGFVGTVPRAEKVNVRGQDRAGKRVKINADGYLAHILQHEIDHLEGILYVDYLEKGFDDLRPVEPGEKRGRRRRAGGSEAPDEEPATSQAANDDLPNALVPAAVEEAAPAHPTAESRSTEPVTRPTSLSSTRQTSAVASGAIRAAAVFDPCCTPPAASDIPPNSSFIIRHS